VSHARKISSVLRWQWDLTTQRGAEVSLSLRFLALTTVMYKLSLILSDLISSQFILYFDFKQSQL